MKLKLEEITTETLIMEATEREELRKRMYIRQEAMDLGDEMGAAKLHAEKLLSACMWSAIKMSNAGYTKKELAEVFNVELREVTKWLKKGTELPSWLQTSH